MNKGLDALSTEHDTVTKAVVGSRLEGAEAAYENEGLQVELKRLKKELDGEGRCRECAARAARERARPGLLAGCQTCLARAARGHALSDATCERLCLFFSFLPSRLSVLACEPGRPAASRRAAYGLIPPPPLVRTPETREHPPCPPRGRRRRRATRTNAAACHAEFPAAARRSATRRRKQKEAGNPTKLATFRRWGSGCSAAPASPNGRRVQSARSRAKPDRVVRCLPHAQDTPCPVEAAVGPREAGRRDRVRAPTTKHQASLLIVLAGTRYGSIRAASAHWSRA